jgi:crotonobetainyl-CoA:carnitine CoA-transferase CaiB-like acyl-CoA transferase
VSTPRDLVADPHLAARGFFVVAPIGGRTVALPGSPLHATPPLVDVTGRPPRFGEHTASVLRGLLGWSEHGAQLPKSQDPPDS